MDYFHSKGIMHRDIKPQNIIINHKSRDVKIIDWGLAEYYVPGLLYHPRVATRYYKSPEILLGMEDYHYALDIWSLGCIFAELTLRKLPFFSGKDNSDQLLKIVQVIGTSELSKFVEKYNLKMPEELNKTMYYCFEGE